MQARVQATLNDRQRQSRSVQKCKILSPVFAVSAKQPRQWKLARGSAAVVHSRAGSTCVSRKAEPHNRIIAAVPKKEQARLADQLEPVQLGLKDVLYEPGQPIRFVYFPMTCVISLVKTMKDGRVFEFATVGNEGMAGIPLLLGATSEPATALAQIAGAALRMRAANFGQEVARGGALPDLLHRYTEAFLNQVAQSVSCNRAHDIVQRCGRWLLMTHDRVDGDQFALTQEFLAQMLGVQRASANKAAGMLQDRALIAHRRGRITILDRKGLERVACECYKIVRDEFERLMP